MPVYTSNPEERLKSMAAGIQNLLKNAGLKKESMLESGKNEAPQGDEEYVSMMKTFEQGEGKIIDKCRQVQGELNKTLDSVIAITFENVKKLCLYCKGQLELLIKATEENIAIAKKNAAIAEENIAIAKKNAAMKQSSAGPRSEQSGQAKPELKRTTRYRNLTQWLNGPKNKNESETLGYEFNLPKGN